MPSPDREIPPVKRNASGRELNGLPGFPMQRFFNPVPSSAAWQLRTRGDKRTARRETPLHCHTGGDAQVTRHQEVAGTSQRFEKPLTSALVTLR
jgi:hypothetical protein